MFNNPKGHQIQTKVWFLSKTFLVPKSRRLSEVYDIEQLRGYLKVHGNPQLGVRPWEVRGGSVVGENLHSYISYCGVTITNIGKYMYINQLIGVQLASQSFEYYCVSTLITNPFRKKNLRSLRLIIVQPYD